MKQSLVCSSNCTWIDNSVKFADFVKKETLTDVILSFWSVHVSNVCSSNCTWIDNFADFVKTYSIFLVSPRIEYSTNIRNSLYFISLFKLASDSEEAYELRNAITLIQGTKKLSKESSPRILIL